MALLHSQAWEVDDIRPLGADLLNFVPAALTGYGQDKDWQMTLEEISLRVLIVDDNRDGADALGILIEELGNQVKVTYGGRQALEVVSEYRPDLVLVDLVMPDIDGFDLVARLRQISAFSQTKIVAVSRRKDEKFNHMAMKVGCDDVLIKPATLTVIKTVLASVTPSISKPAN